jgi:threonine dehydratase
MPAVGSRSGVVEATVGLAEIQRARQRITQHIRRTPTVAALKLRQPIAPGARVLLKLENLQVTGSFKARGAVHKLLALEPRAVRGGLITASGGNHGVGVAYAGWIAGVPATVFFPRPTPRSKIERVERWGARVVLEGNVYDEADAAALETARREGLVYVHAFADADVIAGQGTLGLELLEDAPDLDLAVIAVGGGGLIGGVSAALKALRPQTRIVGVEPTGAPTLERSLAAGRLVELTEITTSAGPLAPMRSAEINLDLVRQHVESIVLVSDEQMREAARWLWLEMGIAAEMAGAAALAALRTGQIPVRAGETVCALVCGAGTDGFSSG